MVPRGSAVMTGAGNLEPSGIRAIIHAATGSMAKTGGVFEPTLGSIKESIKNSLGLARENGFRRIAIPFIGGEIFSQRLGVSPQALADLIVETSLTEAQGVEVRFVTFGDQDTALFQTALGHFQTPTINAAVLNGSITDFSLHRAPVIVNAANMEVTFGGGLSGAIGRATGRADEINAEARVQIDAWAKELKK